MHDVYSRKKLFIGRSRVSSLTLAGVCAVLKTVYTLMVLYMMHLYLRTCRMRNIVFRYILVIAFVFIYC